jgi:peroxiredoxin
MDTVIDNGSQALRFRLPDLSGAHHSPDEFMDKIVVLYFWSAECDWCHRVDEELKSYMESWKDRVVVLWIASNTNESRELIEKVASERKLPGVLMDTAQQAADLYGALTTPHIFILDQEGKLAYQGAWDDINFRQRMATQVYVPQVVEALMSGKPLPVTQTPSYGCMLVRVEG